MSTGCSQSPGCDTACMPPLSAKTDLGTGDCDCLGLDRAGWDPEASGADPSCHAAKWLRRRLAASATWQLVPRQPLGLRARLPSPRPASPRRVERHGAARTGLARRLLTLPLMAAMMPLTLCAPGLSTCWTRVPCQFSALQWSLPPSARIRQLCAKRRGQM